MICSKSGVDTKASHPRRHNGSSNCLRGSVCDRYCFWPLFKTIDTSEDINTTTERRVWSNKIDVNDLAFGVAKLPRGMVVCRWIFAR